MNEPMEFTDPQSGERITYSLGGFNEGARASYPATYKRCLPLMDGMLKEIYRLRALLSTPSPATKE